MESSCLTFDSETSGQTSEDDGGSTYERIWAECSGLFEGRSDWKDEENEATEEEEGEGNGRIDFNGEIRETGGFLSGDRLRGTGRRQRERRGRSNGS